MIDDVVKVEKVPAEAWTELKITLCTRIVSIHFVRWGAQLIQ